MLPASFMSTLRVMMVLTLALLAVGSPSSSYACGGGDPGNALFASSTGVHVAMTVDRMDANNETSTPGVCLFHGGCAVASATAILPLTVSYPTVWSALPGDMTLGQHPDPDPRPPKSIA